MKLYKIIIMTICLMLLNSIAVLANEWSWDIGDYHYELYKRMEYNEWNDTNVIVYNDANRSHILFQAGAIEGELVDFEVGIYDKNEEQVYNYKDTAAMHHTMTFEDFAEIGLDSGKYRLCIVAKGIIDLSLDDYDLYVSYNNSNNDNNDGNIVTEDNDNKEDDKTQDNSNSQDQNPPSSNDGASSITKTKALKRVSLVLAKRLKNNKKKATIKWKKIQGTKIRYEIKLSTSKKFIPKKTKTYTTKKYNYVISKLTKNKRYYVKVRCYKVINNVKKYGKFSKVKIIK